MNLSRTATLGTEERGPCREVAVEKGLNKSQCMDCPPQKMLLQRDGRCGEVVVSGGSTVVRTIMKLIPLSSFCSYFVGSIVGMFYSFFEVKSR